MLYCDACMAYVPAALETRTKSISIHGASIQVQYKATICGLCGTEIFDDTQEATIMKKARNTFRQKNRMLPASSICSYMEKNNLSPEQMAQRVGCVVGEILSATRGALLDTVVDEKIKKVISA